MAVKKLRPKTRRPERIGNPTRIPNKKETNRESSDRSSTRDEWLKARKDLLVKEKEFTRQRGRAECGPAASCRWSRSTKDYAFEGPDGPVTLRDLFDGRQPARRLPLHARPEPGTKGCKGCSFIMDNLAGNVAHLAARDTSIVARLARTAEKIERFKQANGLVGALVLLVRQRLQLRLPRDAGPRSWRSYVYNYANVPASAQGRQSRCRYQREKCRA